MDLILDDYDGGVGSGGVLLSLLLPLVLPL